jgi:hypothetical protein
MRGAEDGSNRMSLIKTVGSWNEAFDEADALLAQGKLTAVAVTPKMPYENNAFVATHLEEFGDPRTTLSQLRAASPLLHGEKKSLELWHREFKYPWRGEFIEGWLLAVVFPSG